MDPQESSAIIYGISMLAAAGILSLGAVLTAQVLRRPRYRYQLKIEDASMKADTMADLEKLIEVCAKAKGARG